MREKVNIHEKLALIHDHWNPRIVGELNGQHVKLVKFKGEFVWHSHAEEDELFLVSEGEFLVVARGVEHRPVAAEEVAVLLFEPAQTKHTGDTESELTVYEFQRL
jgi:mannose-6-phosphate isomerase-like protein (cupin superfamily)